VIWQPDPEVEKLFEAAMAAAPQSSGDNLPGLITVISNDIAALAGQVDERDLRYISRGWADVQTELNAEPIDKEELQKVMTRLADDLNTTGGSAKAVIPKLESLLKLVLQLD
jgi:hypothetical protein